MAALSPAGRRRWRKRWLDIHLWAGLAFGLWLSLVGLSGAVLTFHPELERAFHAPWFQTRDQGGAPAFKPLNEIVAAATAAMPAGARFTFAFYPQTDDGTYWLYFDVPVTRVSGKPSVARWDVFVDPYTARVMGKRLKQVDGDWAPREFFAFMFSLHYQLLVPGGVGEKFVGVMALLAMASILAGLYLWWPSPGRWKAALSIKRHASTVRFVYDLHNISGVYLAPVLLAVLFSGVYLNLRPEFVWVVQQVSPATRDRYTIRSHAPAPGARPIGLHRALQIARETYPQERADMLYEAFDADASYMVCTRGARSASRFADQRCLVIDQYRGAILHQTVAGTETAGTTLIAWQRLLHSGEAFGLPGRMLVLLSGLALPVLFVSGLVRWLQKRRARRRASRAGGRA